MAIAGRRIHLVRLFTRITLTGRRWIADDNQIAMVELRVHPIIAIPYTIAIIKLKGGNKNVQLNRRAQIVAILSITIVPRTDLDMLL